MTQPITIEGTGEEIMDFLKLAPRGRYRITRLSEAEAPASDGNGSVGQSLAEALQGYIGTADFGDANLSTDTGKKFAQMLEEKRRGQQD